MKHVLLTAIAAVALAAAPASAAASCRVPGGRTVARDKIALLIAIPTPRGSALFACIRRSGRKSALDDNYSDARLAGRWAAWQRHSPHGVWRIVVRDLRTGRERFVIGHVAEASLRLTTTGTVVWAQLQDASPATPLFANEARRGGRLLDGGAVNAASVRLAGRRVTWVSDGQAHSALVR